MLFQRWRAGGRKGESVENQSPADAWVEAEVRYRAGQRVQGVVTRLAQFGIFFQLEPGVEGVLYTFELGPGALAGFVPGQQVGLYVKDVDARRRRLELSLEDQRTPGLFSQREVPAQVRRKTSLPGPELPPLAPETGGPGEQHCPACLRPVQPTWKYCVYCAGTLQRRCPACGSAQPDLAGARYCCECGQALR